MADNSETCRVEGINAELHHYLTRLARKSRDFSRRIHALRQTIRLFVFVRNARQLHPRRFPLLISCENAIVTAVNAVCRETSSVRLNPHKQVRLARLLLDRSYDAPITIEDLSREVALSPYYLIRAFKYVYKQTPHQYLVQQRIARAKELLRTTDLPVTEICLAVGFESLGSFSTLFSKVVGISPSAYRVSCNPNLPPAYIPFCVCLLHGIED
ncbi:MAG: helix-turn-helix transcriptional regulator [Anaerolineae bacterium]|nr:helix-turn-helix transcriptional regulator [Anaerolineae bacterium]